MPQAPFKAIYYIGAQELFGQYYFYPHLTDAEMEAQRDLFWSKATSWGRVALEFPGVMGPGAPY